MYFPQVFLVRRAQRLGTPTSVWTLGLKRNQCQDVVPNAPREDDAAAAQGGAAGARGQSRLFANAFSNLGNTQLF